MIWLFITLAFAVGFLCGVVGTLLSLCSKAIDSIISGEPL